MRKLITFFVFVAMISAGLPLPTGAATEGERDFISTASSRTVAPSQRAVEVMNFLLPLTIVSDQLIDADGTATMQTGENHIPLGARLFPLVGPDVQKIRYTRIGFEELKEGKMKPDFVWLDRDGSIRYTIDYKAGTAVKLGDTDWYAPLSTEPGSGILYVDEDKNGLRGGTEPVYRRVTNDGFYAGPAFVNLVTSDHVRVTPVLSEKLLINNKPASLIVKDNTVGFDGVAGEWLQNWLYGASVSSTMKLPQWKSTSEEWADGRTLVLDADNDGLYVPHMLNSIAVRNTGTASNASIEKVYLTADGEHVADLVYNRATGQWSVSGLKYPLSETARLRVMADVRRGAVDGATMQFAVDASGIVTAKAQYPERRIANINVQTIDTDGRLVDPQAPVADGGMVIPEGVIQNVGELQNGDTFMVFGQGSGGTVYAFENGKKNPYPSQRVFLTWWPDFESAHIKVVSSEVVTGIPWGKSVRYRSGTRMIKIPEDLKVYAVTPGGVCWVKDENVAAHFYGPNWASKIDDIQASMFVSNYALNPSCDLSLDSLYPTATLLGFGGQRYYVENKMVRTITDDGWRLNRFQELYLIPAHSFEGYGVGNPLTTAEFIQVTAN